MDSPSNPATTWLFLVRHGATEANESRPYVLQGRYMDLTLSEAGQQQAESVGRFLSGFAIRRVFSSPLRRAIETAKAIAKPHGLTIQTLDALTECDVGRWEGKDWDSIMRDDPEAYQRFRDDPATHPYVGGETYADVLTRVRPALKHLLDRHAGETIVVVAHNVVNRVFLSELLGVELRRASQIPQTNACVNIIRQRGDEIKLLTLNGIFHLGLLPRQTDLAAKPGR